MGQHDLGNTISVIAIWIFVILPAAALIISSTVLGAKAAVAVCRKKK